MTTDDETIEKKTIEMDPLYINEYNAETIKKDDAGNVVSTGDVRAIDEPVEELHHVIISGLPERNVGGRPCDGIQVCDICGFETYQRYLLRNHMDTHSEAKYKCQWKDCNKQYKQKKHLQEHERNAKHRQIDH